MDIATKQVPPLSGTPPATLADAASNAFVTQVATAVYLNALSGQSVPPGTVRMVRTSDSNNALTTHANWMIFSPDGGVIDITGTTTQGLQEAINYAATFGYDLVVSGGQVKAASAFGAYDGQDPAIIDCTTTIEFPPMEKAYIYIGAVTINSTAATGVRFDSMIICTVRLCEGGQINMSSANAVGVKFSPRNGVPADAAFGVGIGGTCHVFVGSVIVPGGGTGQCIQFDTVSGPIQESNEFVFSEVNGGSTGILVVDGAYPFAGNIITGYAVHGATSQAALIGQSAAGAAFIGGNKWFLDLYPANGANGVDLWASGGDYFLISGVGTGTSIAVKFESSADGNIVDLHRASAFTTKVSDLSTSNGNAVRGHSDRADVDLGGTDQVGIATGTYTKVLFSGVNENTNGSWSAVNKRWAPMAGIVLISAQVFWTAVPIGTVARIAIYRNGNLMHGGESWLISAAAFKQGAQISRTARAGASDYFEIWVSQNSGGNLDISGDINDTWANFTRLGD